MLARKKAREIQGKIKVYKHTFLRERERREEEGKEREKKRGREVEQ